jgi:hypothetical protein
MRPRRGGGLVGQSVRRLKRAIPVVLAIGGSVFSVASCTTTPDALSIACSRLFDDSYEPGICGTRWVPPAAELARWRSRFDRICAIESELPGSAFDAAFVTVCTAALEQSHCTSDARSLEACAAPGALAIGRPCSSSLQCRSGVCRGDSACGVCAAFVPVGEGSCSPSIGDCAPGSQCDGQSLLCVATSGTLGSRCPEGVGCQEPLYCDLSVLPFTCRATGGLGSPCTSSSACGFPLVCRGSLPSCQPAAQSGEACANDGDCGTGLVCGATSGTCMPIVWAGSGDPCGGDTRCLLGTCPVAPGTKALAGVCPTVVSDGGACDPLDWTKTCDVFASCVGGSCVLGSPRCT